ncbi:MULTISPECIES: cell division protein ZapA [unclassified Massilia]|uniref:cell division protein ZapA n=1 Tax=unclassified Massilia TaxID=2609279 RepID=UPI001594E1F3|nr:MULTISPECIES: cell division protein ZapA [unclassified Massilia]NVD98173.1 cell division protein ZapA [Massilia sp. BJB1822]UTY58138.1 cell division protein ZapA [Massilia sp. erpn]
MIQLDVSIMGQPYRLACKEGEERALREAASLLDKKMSGIRDAGKIKGNDRIAVMAALGMAAEFLTAKSPQGPLSDMSLLEVQQKIAAMQKVLDGALTPQENLF